MESTWPMRSASGRLGRKWAVVAGRTGALAHPSGTNGIDGDRLGPRADMHKLYRVSRSLHTVTSCSASSTARVRFRN